MTTWLIFKMAIYGYLALIAVASVRLLIEAFRADAVRQRDHEK